MTTAASGRVACALAPSERRRPRRQRTKSSPRELESVSTNGASPTITPGEILERLKQRITELETKLSEAQHQGHRRLQDLSPDELALEAVGAAGDIIKAARQQAADTRQAADAESASTREAAQRTLASAKAQADQMRADTEAARDTMLNETRETVERALARVRQEADDITAKAVAESDEMRRTAQAESESLFMEAQRRLQASLHAAEQATQEARDEARRIVEEALAMAESIREEARTQARAVIDEVLSQLHVQEEMMRELLTRAISMRSSVGTVLDSVRVSADAIAAEGARAEAVTQSYLATISQLKADMQARTGPSQPRD